MAEPADSSTCWLPPAFRRASRGGDLTGHLGGEGRGRTAFWRSLVGEAPDLVVRPPGASSHPQEA